MTCLLNTYAQISNLENLLEQLELEELTSLKSDNTLKISEPVSHESVARKPEMFNRDRKESWFDSCHLSISPDGSLIAIANKQKVLICKRKWDLNNQIKFITSSQINFEEPQKEYITSIICIPIASQRVSGEGLMEWICIIVGTNLGNIRIYTESGVLLISQMFHDEKVLKFKCRTYESARYIGWISQPEEVEILYENNVLVCLDGANLYHYLRAAKKYTAHTNDSREISEAISSLSLDYKKWRFESQEVLNDFVTAGLTSDNKFDQMFYASMIGDADEKFSSIPPMTNRYLTTGNLPFLSSYYALEGMSQPVINEVKALAGKVTSALMNSTKNWFGFGKSSNTTSQPKVKVEPPTGLSARFSIRDYRRHGDSLIISPANNIAATTDSFGRVILFDTLKGIAIRIFKGYRDAQIGWICVDDESDEKENRRYALYLVIYAPRRGLLEIWGCQQGIRVAAFNVGKDCKLIYSSYFMLSLNGSLTNDKVKSAHQIQCCLLTSDGLLKTIHVPFHLILSDKSNERVRDTILLKKLKTTLRESTAETNAIWEDLELFLKEIKTPFIKQQALERILSIQYLSPQRIMKTFQNELEEIEKQGENVSTDMNKLGKFCRYNIRLIFSYIFISEMNEPKSNTEEKVTELAELTQVEETELENYFNLKGLTTKTKNSTTQRKVKFAIEPQLFNLAQYLSCFEFSSNNTLNQDAGFLIKSDYSKQKYFHLNKAITLQEKQMIGDFLFSDLIQSEFDEHKFLQNFLKNIPLAKMNMLDLLVQSWLNNSFTNISTFFKLFSILSGFAKLEPVKNVSDQNEIIESSDEETNTFEAIFVNEYLFKLKSSLENSTSFLNSLLIALIVRSMLIQAQMDSNQIETFDLLIHRLICMIRLKVLLMCGKLSFLDNCDLMEFNLKNVLTKGKGILSEIVAKHIVLNKYPAKLLNFIEEEQEDEEFQSLEEKADRQEELKLLKEPEYKEFYDTLQETRNFLPKSLESDTLFINSAFEAINIYNKDPEADIVNLEICLRFCGEIGNAILKQGILVIIWHNYLSKRVAGLTDLIDRNGKLPKSLKKEIQVDESTVVTFLECIMTMLDLIMDANCNINEVPIFNYDKFWKDHNTDNEASLISTNQILSLSNVVEKLSLASSHSEIKSITSSKQLVELAAEQKQANYHLCLFHYQLVRILYLITKYKMKAVHPYAFFDTKGKYALFAELHTHPYFSNDVDLKISNARKMFFTKALNAILEQVDLPTNIKCKLPKEVSDNLNMVFNLSKDMGVDDEYVKSYYCCMLYALDYHSEAEKLLHSLKESELIASQLLVVVGLKVNEIMKANFDANLLAILSTNLNSWLKTLGHSDYRIYTTNSKQALLELIGIVLNRLPDTFSEYKIASELFDFIQNSQFQIK